MVEKTRRGRVAGESTTRDGEWEVFVRADGDDQVRRVGSVVAADASAAHELATRLYAWYAPEVWVVPARAVVRFDEDAAGDATPAGDDEERVYED